MDRSLGARLARHPIIATLYGAEQIDAFVDSTTEIAIVANVELRKLHAVVATITRADKIAIVNIDSCEGISPDKGGVEYLAEIGATSLVSTRVATIQRANRAGLLTMQKVFVTDRSTWPRSVKALEQSDPNLVQLMPAPMLPHISAKERNALPPIVASGFVVTPNDVRSALAAGAVAVSTSDAAMWSLDIKPLNVDELRPR
ncbi:glycerol uptake operon antiterminator [Variovorax boronicumulans]|uniref:Glycerol uptake operon antiterminator n=1 Tax=Variovorax boronicumulans TaxID=436515 RepID=A0AAW8DTG3_9BURK|nr:glycerol-3-phosphate responsive antiterminator [Variovorax boronicumulans]MDP9877523.1 glycerol uptake operon antiterminator [Variovorax boronicumulans]MDP9922808.1 glycerol uptake operon antiterminator [Variovorax boronicumulans]